ncbi:hypothetical protein QC763_117250 [Podospora pseudopauciseta]|uniref:Metallo-beta-lactamase domain-containing protein n=1 Tax=Podospora pseudopauciseta TaxID=2093780 RepID=A0ABR0I1J6_9PEZI|nr:hypothetical protein QC763_117250 [Podospora pseudopauciseta]
MPRIVPSPLRFLKYGLPKQPYHHQQPLRALFRPTHQYQSLRHQSQGPRQSRAGYNYNYDHNSYRQYRPPNRWSIKRHIGKGYLEALILIFFLYKYKYPKAIMSSSLIPDNPDEVMVIRDLTPNVAIFSVPFSRFGKIPIGGRGTAVRLTSGSIAVFSPVALTEATKAKIASWGGQVKYLVATDIEHHIFLSEWKKAYPAAKLIGPEGLPEKRLKVKNDPKIGHEPFDVVIGKNTPRPYSVDAEFDKDFEVEYIASHPNKEVVFLYKPDKVLIEADLLFNLPATEQYSKVPEEKKPKPGLLGGWFMGMNSTEGEAKGMKRFLWWVVSRADREGFNEIVGRMYRDWDFEVIVPCHGEVIEKGAKEVWGRVFEWHLEGKK